MPGMDSNANLQCVTFDIMADNIEVFKQWGDNLSFKRWLVDIVFSATYNADGISFDEAVPVRKPYISKENL